MRNGERGSWKEKKGRGSDFPPLYLHEQHDGRRFQQGLQAGDLVDGRGCRRSGGGRARSRQMRCCRVGQGRRVRTLHPADDGSALDEKESRDDGDAVALGRGGQGVGLGLDLMGNGKNE